VGCGVHEIGMHKKYSFHFCIGKSYFNKGPRKIKEEEKERKEERE